MVLGRVFGIDPHQLPVDVRCFEVARHTPELRQLFPFFSHWKLCFSRCTGWPYTYDLPCITPKFSKVTFRQSMREALMTALHRLPADESTEGPSEIEMDVNRGPPIAAGRYVILESPDTLKENIWGRVQVKERPLGEGTAEEAIRLVVESLPEDCGLAVSGTADYL